MTLSTSTRPSATGSGVSPSVFAVVLGLLVSACGTDAPPPEGAAEPAVQEEEGVVVIRMLDDMTFEPEHPEINAGDRVVWVNEGNMPHTATGEPGRAANPEHNILPEGAQPFDSGMLASGEEFSHVFEIPGEYTYLCWLHEALGMVGHITVR